MKVGTLGIFERMSQKNNKALKVAPLSNVASGRSGKNGWGEISVAVPNEIIVNFLSKEEYYVGGLIICERAEFEKEKALVESEEN